MKWIQSLKKFNSGKKEHNFVYKEGKIEYQYNQQNDNSFNDRLIKDFNTDLQID